jgi:hypothetical protein
MKNYTLVNRIIVGFKRKPLKFFVNAFIVYATVWAILEPIIGIVPNTAQYFSGEAKFIALLFASVCVGLYRNAVPNEIYIKYGNSSIVVVFGDLFSFDGFKVIPVSRFFFETQVVPTSLQNKLIKMFVQSREGGEGLVLYNQSLSVALQEVTCEEKYRDATRQQEKYYPLGTTAILELNGQSYMLFALAETELKGHIPNNNCNISRMWIAVGSFWEEARIQARGRSINVPLIGSGVTGIRLNSTRLLEINLLAIANAIEEGGKITTEEVRVILHPKYMEDINLSDFKDIWN